MADSATTLPQVAPQERASVDLLYDWSRTWRVTPCPNTTFQFRFNIKAGEMKKPFHELTLEETGLPKPIEGDSDLLFYRQEDQFY